MNQKDSWFIVLREKERFGIGECGLLRGLSVDDRPGYEEKLQWVCENIHMGAAVLDRELAEWPSIRFGLEAAFVSLGATNPMIPFPSKFTAGEVGIPINGLIWMGDPAYMKKQVSEKIDAGFRCLKMKVGAIDFKAELEILRQIRRDFSPQDLEIRVDANGAFSVDSALDKIRQISGFEIHSIEQPVAVNQHDSMAELVKSSPIPIALDEELIGVAEADMFSILDKIRPHYVILKPSLLGGFAASRKWIDLAERNDIGWWVTSALESSVGLNAIAQWTYTLEATLPQGLGTGALYTNNFESPLQVREGKLWHGHTSWSGLPL